jgi:acyl carrier protein
VVLNFSVLSLVGKEKDYMTRDEIKYEIIRIFREQFEIENPGLDEDLREIYEFDSIDAIELLREIETFLNSELTRAEKKKAMEIQTVNQILDYVELLSLTRAKG